MTRSGFGGAVPSETHNTPSMETSVQWADLPGDLLQVVYLNVGSFLHRVRFAVVCRSWRPVAIAARHAAPPTLPWLIFPSLHGDD